MEYRSLGRTGLKVSKLCVGGNVFGWTCDEPTSFGVLDTLLSAGWNFVDTANNYSRFAPGNVGGESESIIGNWLKQRANRSQVIVATKVGGPMGDTLLERGLSRRHIMQSVEASLRRLRTDYIDLYYAHFDDLETRPDEYMRAFDDLVRQGKVIYLGASNFTPWRLVQAQRESERDKLTGFECLQPEYNLIAREGYERNFERLCKDLQLGVVCYYALAAGFLTGKYRRGAELPEGSRARTVKSKYVSDRGFSIVDEVVRVAADLGATPGQVALAWLMARPGVTSAIASARTEDQARELVAAAELTLPATLQEALTAVSGWET